MDKVFVRNLPIEAVIGVYEWERDIRQTLIFDIEMSTDVANAARQDSIHDALDYQAVSDRLREYVSQTEFQLIETLAERCAGLLREEFGIGWLRLAVNKRGAVGEGVDVGVVIERGSCF